MPLKTVAATEIASETRDPSRFDELISAYGRLIRGVVRRSCGPLADLYAEDAEQEVHLALWRFLSDGKTIDRPHAFFVRVSTRIALRMVRRAWRFEDEPAEEPATPRGRFSDPDQALGIRQAVDDALAQLTQKRRAAVRAYLMGMSHEEVARFYGWSATTARHAIYDGLKQLRAHLREQGADIDL